MLWKLTSLFRCYGRSFRVRYYSAAMKRSGSSDCHALANKRGRMEEVAEGEQPTEKKGKKRNKAFDWSL